MQACEGCKHRKTIACRGCCEYKDVVPPTMGERCRVRDLEEENERLTVIVDAAREAVRTQDTDEFYKLKFALDDYSIAKLKKSGYKEVWLGCPVDFMKTTDISPNWHAHRSEYCSNCDFSIRCSGPIPVAGEREKE